MFSFIFAARTNNNRRERFLKNKKIFEDLVSKKRSKQEQSELENVQEQAIEIAVEVAKKGEGCLLVVGDTNSFETHFPNLFSGKKFSIFQKGMDKVLTQLAVIDGAVIIDQKGKVRAYGARVTKQSSLKGSGTRHAAAKGISKEKDVVSIIASEEDKLVKIFKEGQLLVEINPFTKGVEKQYSKIVDFLHSPDAAVAAGAAIAIPFFGPGVIVFAGSYYVAKNLLGLARKK